MYNNMVMETYFEHFFLYNITMQQVSFGIQI